MGTATEYIVIRWVVADELRICRIAIGYRPEPEPGYTWGGPFKTEKQAIAAVKNKDESLRWQLYPETNHERRQPEACAGSRSARRRHGEPESPRES